MTVRFKSTLTCKSLQMYGDCSVYSFIYNTKHLPTHLFNEPPITKLKNQLTGSIEELHNYIIGFETEIWSGS